MSALERWIYLMELGKKLGCHQMPERSFSIGGYQFPVCARCTGVLASVIPAVLLFRKKRLPVLICFAMSGVMLGDWLLQFMGIQESTNPRRFLTGFIGGWGYMTLHFSLYRSAVGWLRKKVWMDEHSVV